VTHLRAFLAEEQERRPGVSSQARTTAALKSACSLRPAARMSGSGTSPASPSATGCAVFGAKPHRIAYRSALDWHGLLEHPSRRIVLAVDKRAGFRELSGRQLRVVLERADRVGVGAIDAGHGARVSSLERALVESAARPALAGGIQVVATALARAKPDTGALEEIARSLGARTAFHRLGSIAKTLDLRPLGQQLTPMSSIGRPIPLDPAHTDSVEGWRDEKWGVDWPFPASELEETVRR
jgi:predicted transcriptional regulator of viral defense system